MQQCGNRRRVGNAQPDQGEDAQFRREASRTADFDTGILREQAVELPDKRREKPQEGGVEIVVEFLQFVAPDIGSGILAPQFVGTSVAQHFADIAIGVGQFVYSEIVFRKPPI